MSTPEISVKIDEAGLSKLLQRFAAYKDKTVPEIVRAQGRLVAVNLAFNTQPYGDDDAARFKGQNAVRNDIGRVFVTPQKIMEIVKASPENRLLKWIGQSLEKENVEEFKTGWQRFTRGSIIIGKTVDPAYHKAQRNARGRVRRNVRPMIVMNEASIKAYTRAKEKLVGFGKSGWAAAARALGGTRGIPGWVSRNKGPGGVEDHTRGKTDHPYVVLQNSVSYISQILPQAERDKAIHLQGEKMLRAMEHQFEAEKKAAA